MQLGEPVYKCSMGLVTTSRRVLVEPSSSNCLALVHVLVRRTDVVEFVSTEHTPRNLLIRAVKRRKAVSDAGAIELAREYKQLRDAWGVRPQLEKLLKDSLPPAVVEVLTS